MKNYTYRYRLAPTNTQKYMLLRYFGCDRFVYNYYLNKSIQDYQQDNGTKWNYYRYKKDLVELKKEYIRLQEANSQSLQAVLENLDKSYNNFFKKGLGFPNFKKKGGKQSTKIPQHFKIEGNMIYIPKTKIGIKFVKHRDIQGKVKSLTISQDTDGKYYVTILVEKDMVEDNKTGKEVGIDLGLKDLAITSDGDKYKTLKQNTKEIERLQMRQSKKQKGSRRYKQLKTKIAKLHKSNANRRNDYLDKISRSIVKDYDLIGFENLNVKGMMANRRLSKAIGNQGRTELVNKVIYKADWYGKQTHKISRWYPTSKQCYKCGNVNKELKLSDRMYKCSKCGSNHDRDIGAAQNILQYTKIELKE